MCWTHSFATLTLPPVLPVQVVQKTIRSASLVSLQRDTHVLEVPESVPVPRDWEPRAGKKGVKRYISPELRKLVDAREVAEQTRQDALAAILSVRTE